MENQPGERRALSNNLLSQVPRFSSLPLEMDGPSPIDRNGTPIEKRSIPEVEEFRQAHPRPIRQHPFQFGLLAPTRIRGGMETFYYVSVSPQPL